MKKRQRNYFIILMSAIFLLSLLPVSVYGRESMHQDVEREPSGPDDWVSEFYNSSFEAMTADNSWIADEWNFSGGVNGNGAWLTDAAAHTGTYSQAVNADNNDYTIKQSVPVQPGIYEVRIYVWADGNLGESSIMANGAQVPIKSNGAVQIDGEKTWDEIILKGVPAVNGWLDVSISIQGARVTAGFLDDISFLLTGDYLEPSSDASDGGLLNGGFASLEAWKLTGDTNAIKIETYGFDGSEKDTKLSFWRETSFRAGAYQDIKNLENGVYLVSAYVWTDSDSFSVLFANSFDGEPDIEVNAPVSSGSWKLVSFRTNVTNGYLRVGAKIEGAAEGWLAVDNFSVTYIDSDSTDIYINNNGFEEGETDWTVGGSIVEHGFNNSRYSLQHSKAGVQESCQKLSGLENGYYTLTGYVQNTGGQSAAYLYADDFGDGSKAITAVPRTNFPYDEEDTWKKVTIRGIHITNGSLKIGLYTNSIKDQYVRLDTLHLEKDDKPYELLIGGDITELTYVEESGGKYFNKDGVQRDPIILLAESGWNIVRIRVYNNPGKGRGDGSYYLPEGYQDVEDALRLAKRAKDAGLQIQLSFHYSDYWSNPGRQIIPLEWSSKIQGMNDTQAVAKLKELVYTFTAEVLNKMGEQGTMPEYVSIGNETRGGMLFGYGSTGKWDNLAQFLKSGAEAVHDIAPASKVIIHLDDGGNVSSYTRFFDAAEARGVDYDIIGTSYYPYWTKKNSYEFADFCNTVAKRYGKPLLCMETGFNWNELNGAGRVGQLMHNGPYGDRDSSSPQLQRDFMIELFNAMKGVENGMCIGDLYWDPIMIYADGNTGWAYFESDDTVDVNVVDNTTLFDFDGIELPVLDAYRFNTEGRSTGLVTGKVTDLDGVCLAGITISNGIITVTSNVLGEFVLPQMQPGKYTLIVSSGKYDTSSTEFTLEAGEVLVLNTVLKTKGTSSVKPSGVTSGSTSSLRKAFEWKKDNNGWWLVTDSASGYAQSEWRQVSGKWYYFDSDGYMAAGWRLLGDNNWYWLNPGSGEMVENAWIFYQDKWYYLGTDGAMVTGWLYYENDLYYLSKENNQYYGHMVTDIKTPDGYYVDINGRWLR